MNSLLEDPNINKQNLTKKQKEFSYLITGNPKKRTLLFRPDLVSICKGSAWAVLLFDQLYYYLEWKSNLTKKSITEVEIYKFLSPCNHPLYKKGDSFCEELKITEYKFRTAIQKIGFKTNWKTTEEEIKKSNSLILYRKDAKNVTWYKLNPFILNNFNPEKKPKKIPKQRTSSSGKQRTSSSGNEGPQVRYNIEDNIENTYSKKTINKNKTSCEATMVGKKVQEVADSDLLTPGEPKGSQGPSVLKDSRVKKVSKRLNGSNNKSSCKKAKNKTKSKKKNNIAKISNLPKLQKIQIKPNPLHKFNFPQEVFEILNHWKILGGQIPKDPSRRKIADKIETQIQELLIKGNNPYTPVLKDNELEKFRTKKWTVQEIKDSITHFKKELCKPIESMTFLQFIVHRNYKKNQKQRDYSPLVSSFSVLPQELSYISKNLKERFTDSYPDIHIYDKVFINIATFLEEKLELYKDDQPFGGNLYFEPRFVSEIFYYYMDKKLTPKGTYDELKYMSNPQNLKEFMQWCFSMRLIKRRTQDEIRKHKKELKEGYKNQLQAFQKDIDNGKAENWNDDTWAYVDYVKEQFQELITC